MRFSLFIVLFLLSGCLASAQEGNRQIIVTDGPYTRTHAPAEGTFCPPGQAKKGRC